MYRKIATVRDEADESELIDELIDRYGDPPPAILGLIKVSLLRNAAAALGMSEIVQRGGFLLFYIQSPKLEQVQALSTRYAGRVLYKSDKERYYIEMKLLDGQKPEALMREVISTMQEAGK